MTENSRAASHYHLYLACTSAGGGGRAALNFSVHNSVHTLDLARPHCHLLGDFKFPWPASPGLTHEGECYALVVAICLTSSDVSILPPSHYLCVG